MSLVERNHKVRQIISTVQGIAERAPLEREALDLILQQLLALASRPEWWSDAEFPTPGAGELHARYLISEESDRTFALYLNVMRPGKRIAPHNHTTWAAIAAVEGSEFNHIYRRADDGGLPGVATLEHAGTIEVGPGRGIALMPDDIHAVEIRGTATIRHLHLYGRALETLNERISFDPENRTYARMPIGVATRRKAEAGYDVGH